MNKRLKWWDTSIISALGKLRLDCESQASLGYTARPSLKTQHNTTKQIKHTNKRFK
jgi:hypothetical protein